MNLDNKQEDLNSKKNRPLGCMTIVSGLGCGCLTAIIENHEGRSLLT